MPFLREGGPDFITQITNSLTFDVYLPGDVVIREGTIGDEMFFIRNGTVDVVAEGQHVTTLTEGDYFGGMNSFFFLNTNKIYKEYINIFLNIYSILVANSTV